MRNLCREKKREEDEVKTRFFMDLAVLALTGFVVTAAPVHAGTNVNINLGIPAPEMVVIPQSNVHFAPGVSVDLFYYDNHWWNRRGDRWYRGSGYNRPWVAVGPRYVPAPVYRIPADYRTVYGHEKRIPYGQWKNAHGNHGGKYKGEKHGNKHGHHEH
jgi:hypothetical protein